MITRAEVHAAWERGREAFAKGATKSPGLPIAPRPSRKRAPRPKAPFDVVEGVSHPSTVYQFKPHRLGDLQELHTQDSYEKERQTTPRKRTPKPVVKVPGKQS